MTTPARSLPPDPSLSRFMGQPSRAVPATDPPHGGSWRRLEDGSLELLHMTQPTHGRVQRTPETDTQTLEE